MKDVDPAAESLHVVSWLLDTSVLHRELAAMRQHQSDDLGEHQREGKDQSGAWRNGTSFGLNDLEALVSVARDAKEWIAAHALKR